MKKSKSMTVFFFLFMTMAFQVYGQNMRIMSFNIRYNNPEDGINSWTERKSELVGLIDYYHPGILGLQEGLQDQLIYIDKRLADYSMIGVGREDGKSKGEYAAIFYDSTKYQLVSQNTFWLSKNPDKVSIGWDAVLERICTYGLFRIKETNESVHVFNTHFDHVGTEAQKMSAQLIVKKIDQLTDDNSIVILMGDLNCEPTSEPIKTLKTKLADGMESSRKTFYGPLGTFNAFDAQMSLDKRIDYIFTRNLRIMSYRHIDDKRKDQNFVSDHLPVLVKSKTVKQ